MLNSLSFQGELDKEVFESRKNVIAGRKCLCNEPIKVYTFSCIMLPFENDAIKRLTESNEMNSKFPFLPFKYYSLSTWFRYVMYSECQKCGHIDFWRLTNEDIYILASEEMSEAGYGIELTYEYEDIKNYITKISNKTVKESLEALIKLFPKKDKNDGSSSK